MASITRVQHFQNDTVALLAVEGAGTTEFWSSNMPKNVKAGLGVVFTGTLRVTESSRSDGYFFLMTDRKAGSAGRRAFFKGSALVRLEDGVTTVDSYYAMMESHEAMTALQARLTY